MRRIEFENLPMLEPAEGVRCRTAAVDGRQLRLVEFAVGFCEREWCGKGHVGYVLAGRLEIEFDDWVEVFSAGEGLVIWAGDRHRAGSLMDRFDYFLSKICQQMFHRSLRER